MLGTGENIVTKGVGIQKDYGVDLELFFATEVLHLKSLHYGYWEVPPHAVELGLADVRDAQARYTEFLLSWIPADTATILDVGSGIGDNALAMTRKGYAVTSLSPDKNHRKFYEAPSHQRITFHGEKFEDFKPEKRFDLILMSESQNEFDVETGFEQCGKLVQPGGHFLVCGMFRKQDSRAFGDIWNIERPYVERAQCHGFALVKARDITDNVLPTLETADRALREYLDPVLDVIGRYLEGSAPLKLRLLKLFFRKQVKELSGYREYYLERVNPELFKRHVKYMLMLFRARG